MQLKAKRLIAREFLFSLPLIAGVISLFIEQYFVSLFTGLSNAIHAGLDLGSPVVVAERHAALVKVVVFHRVGIYLIILYGCYLLFRFVSWAIETLNQSAR